MTPDFADDGRWLALIERLDEPERQVVQMRFLERRAIEEIAAETATTPLIVARRLLLGLRRLREALEEESPR